MSKECVMVNNHFTGQPATIIFGKNMIKEYLTRENDYVSRADPNELPPSFKSYIFQTGDHTVKYKSRINRLFTQEKLSKLNDLMLRSFTMSIPKIEKIISEGEKDSEGYVDFDIKIVVDKVMNYIHSSMAFGDNHLLSKELQGLSFRIEDVFENTTNQ